MSEDKNVVIVGAGHGRGNLCAALHQASHTGPIRSQADETWALATRRHMNKIAQY
jgi:hypothetical protein